jgi:hypothetical protein
MIFIEVNKKGLAHFTNDDVTELGTLSSLIIDVMENVPQLIISICSAKPGQMSFLLDLSLVPTSSFGIFQ